MSWICLIRVTIIPVGAAARARPNSSTSDTLEPMTAVLRHDDADDEFAPSIRNIAKTAGCCDLPTGAWSIDASWDATPQTVRLVPGQVGG